MTQLEYEDYMYEDSELEEVVILSKNLEEDIFLAKLSDDAIDSHYDFLAEHYNCV